MSEIAPRHEKIVGRKLASVHEKPAFKPYVWRGLGPSDRRPAEQEPEES